MSHYQNYSPDVTDTIQSFYAYVRLSWAAPFVAQFWNIGKKLESHSLSIVIPEMNPSLYIQKQFDLLTIAGVRLLIVWHVDGHLRQKSANGQIRGSASHSFLHEIS